MCNRGTMRLWWVGKGGVTEPRIQQRTFVSDVEFLFTVPFSVISTVMFKLVIILYQKQKEDAETAHCTGDKPNMEEQ